MVEQRLVETVKQKLVGDCRVKIGINSRAKAGNRHYCPVSRHLRESNGDERSSKHRAWVCVMCFLGHVWVAVGNGAGNMGMWRPNHLGITCLCLCVCVYYVQ